MRKLKFHSSLSLFAQCPVKTETFSSQCVFHRRRREEPAWEPGAPMEMASLSSCLRQLRYLVSTSLGGGNLNHVPIRRCDSRIPGAGLRKCEQSLCTQPCRLQGATARTRRGDGRRDCVPRSLGPQPEPLRLASGGPCHLLGCHLMSRDINAADHTSSKGLPVP